MPWLTNTDQRAFNSFMPPRTSLNMGGPRNLATDLSNNLYNQAPGQTMGNLMQQQYAANPFANNEQQIALNIMRNYAPQYGMPQQTQGYSGFLQGLLGMLPQSQSSMGMYGYSPMAPGIGSLQQALGSFGNQPTPYGQPYGQMPRRGMYGQQPQRWGMPMGQQPQSWDMSMGRPRFQPQPSEGDLAVQRETPRPSSGFTGMNPGMAPSAPMQAARLQGRNPNPRFAQLQGMPRSRGQYPNLKQLLR